MPTSPSGSSRRQDQSLRSGGLAALGGIPALARHPGADQLELGRREVGARVDLSHGRSRHAAGARRSHASRGSG